MFRTGRGGKRKPTWHDKKGKEKKEQLLLFPSRTYYFEIFIGIAAGASVEERGRSRGSGAYHHGGFDLLII